MTQAQGRSASRKSAAERRIQYLDVAAHLAIEQGVAAVTMDAVAASAGVNKALVYRQFANRGELLLALFERETAELDRRITEAVAGAHGFEDQMRAWVHVWFDFMGARGRLLGRIMEARTVSGEVEPRHRQRQHDVVALYGDRYAAHCRVAREVGRDAAAILLAGLIGAIDRWVESPTAATRRRLEESYVDVLLGSLDRLRNRSADDRISVTEPITTEGVAS